VVSPLSDKGLSNIQFLISGLGWTVALALCAITCSVLIGLVVALLGLSRNRGARLINRTYVELLRAIPMLVMVLWVYYGMPIVTGVKLDVFVAGLIALALCDSAFEAEIFRAGIQSIDRGQTEASDSLGLSYRDRMRYIILPQAIRRVLPPLGNQFVYMLKASSLVSVIGLAELTRKANELVVTEYRPLEIYTFLILEYLVLILLVSSAVRWLERRMGASERR
jgi:polar amino acid transport system permease protein